MLWVALVGDATWTDSSLLVAAAGLCQTICLSSLAAIVASWLF
jgi:hypothetical protein